MQKKKIIWRRSPAPTYNLSTDGQALFFVSQDGSLYAVNMKNGQLLWADHTSIKLGDVIVGKELIYVNSIPFRSIDRRITAYAKKTGVLIWQRSLNEPNYAKYGSLASTLHHDKLFVSHVLLSPISTFSEPIRYSSKGSGVYALDAQTGQMLWHADIEAITAPISINNVLYIGAHDSLYALYEETGKERWHLNMEDDVSAIIPYRNKLFIQLGLTKKYGKLLEIS